MVNRDRALETLASEQFDIVVIVDSVACRGPVSN